MPFQTDFSTIAAISTPQGKGGVALVRISGPEANAVGDRIFKRINGKIPSESAPRTALFGEIVDPDSGKRIDTGLYTRFAAPNSFTGEDTVEICCHGGILVTRAVLGAALAAGARRAEAGEFTRRAFAAGKLSLPEAEALGMLLDAGTEAQPLHTATEILRCLNVPRDQIRSVCSMDTDRLPAAQDAMALEKIRQAADWLNRNN